MLQDAQSNVELLSLIVDQIIEGKMKEIEFLSHVVDIQELTGERKAELYSQLDLYQKSQPMLQSVFVGIEKGNHINFPHSEMPADYDPKERGWYKEAMQHKGQAIVTAPYVDQAMGNVVVTIARVTSDERAVIGFDLSLEELTNVVNNTKIGKTGYPFIVDDSRNIVTHPELEAGTNYNDDQVELMFSTPSGTYNDVNEGVKSKITFVTNLTTGWIIAGTLFEQDIADEAQPIFYRTSLIVLINLIVGSVLVYFIMRSVTTPLNILVKASQKISDGDLTQEVEVLRNDEFGVLAQSFNQMSGSLRTLIMRVGETAEQVAASSEQLSASAQQTGQATQLITESIQNVASGSDQQAKRTNETTQTVHHMSSSVQHIAANAGEVEQSVLQTVDTSKNGKKAIKYAFHQMETIHRTVLQLDGMVNNLDEHSIQIGHIISVIKNIAAQTNILALNAAIEAARAGENGRGFAVVANEIRSLAEQTLQASVEIEGEIDIIQGEAKQVVQSMEQGTIEVADGMSAVSVAGDAFNSIETSIDSVSVKIKEVSKATNQLSKSALQFTQVIDEIATITVRTDSDVQQVSASAQEQLASMEEIISSSAELARMADQIQQLLGKFKV